MKGNSIQINCTHEIASILQKACITAFSALLNAKKHLGRQIPVNKNSHEDKVLEQFKSMILLKSP